MANEYAFSGAERFKAAAPRVYDTLADLDGLKDSIPDLVSAQRVDERTLSCVVRPGFSFLRGTLKMTIALDKTEPGRAAAMSVNADGIGVGMKMESRFTVEPDGGGSLVKWEAQVTEMRGLIKAVGSTLIRAAADRVVRDGFARLRARVEM